jgi:hypothetical protein
MKDASPYLTADEAAAHLRKNLHAFACLRSRLKAQGQPLKTYRLGGKGRTFYKQSDLDALFVADEQPSVTAAPGALRGLRMVR